ncbi:MAG TPA: pilus assembly protein TadG-related protein [Pantanalinema sp.]
MRRALSIRRLAREEDGQALIYVALVLAVLVTVLFALFDLGRLTTAKIQAQNGADAAALAAVSVKVSVHHTRELAYLAMTEQGLRARVELLHALGNLNNEAEFQRRLARASGYVKRVEKLRDRLVEYNTWVDQAGPEIVADAARMAYVANIQGMNDHLSTGAAIDAQNVRAFDDQQALRENTTQQQFIGAVNYPNEGLGKQKGGGKSFVEVVPKYQGSNWSLFGVKTGESAVDVPAWASAGYVSSEEIEKDPAAKGQALKIGAFGLRWYSPRLVRTGQKHNGSFGGPNAGGGIVSEH